MRSLLIELLDDRTVAEPQVRRGGSETPSLVRVIADPTRCCVPCGASWSVRVQTGRRIQTCQQPGSPLLPQHARAYLTRIQ